MMAKLVAVTMHSLHVVKAAASSVRDVMRCFDVTAESVVRCAWTRCGAACRIWDASCAFVDLVDGGAVGLDGACVAPAAVSGACVAPAAVSGACVAPEAVSGACVAPAVVSGAADAAFSGACDDDTAVSGTCTSEPLTSVSGEGKLSEPVDVAAVVTVVVAVKSVVGSTVVEPIVAAVRPVVQSVEVAQLALQYAVNTCQCGMWEVMMVAYGHLDSSPTETSLLNVCVVVLRQSVLSVHAMV